MRTRDLLIREIAGLAALVSAFPDAYQDSFLENMSRTVNDAEHFDFSERELAKQKPEFKAAVNSVRVGELSAGPTNASLKISLVQLLVPLADAKLDKVIGLACAEIVHERIWADLEKKHPLEETIPEFKSVMKPPV
jgi:hypothetical protein